MRADLASGKLTEAVAIAMRRSARGMSPEFLDELERAVDTGGLDEGSAGLLSSWGPMIEALRRRTGGSYADLLGAVTHRQGPLTETVYRRLPACPSPDRGRGPGIDRHPRARRDALDGLLELQPDSKSKGELFSAYLRIGRPSAGERHVLDVPFEPPVAPSRRQPDDVNLGSDLDVSLPPGTYAVEHKAGPKAFNIDQAEGYARSFSAPGRPVTTSGRPAEWDGVVYVFSTRTEVKTARGQMQRSTVVRPLLDRPQNGIHLLFLDEAGSLQPFTTGATL